MSSPFQHVLESLMRQRGALATMIVDEHEGMIVDSLLQIGQEGERVAALTASLHRKARQSAGAAGLGAVSFMQLEAARGHICAAGRDNLVLVVVAAPATNIGLLRVEMLRAVQTLP